MKLQYIMVDEGIKADSNYHILKKELQQSYQIIEDSDGFLDGFNQTIILATESKFGESEGSMGTGDSMTECLARYEEMLFISSNPKIASESYCRGIATIGYEKVQNTWTQLRMIVQDLSVIDCRFLCREWKRYHKLPWIIFKTQQLVIREQCETDVCKLEQIYEKREVSQYLEPLFKELDEIEYINNYRKYVYEYYGFGMWAITDRRSHEIIGRAGIEPILYNGKPALELGYMVALEHQGQGVATQACQLIIEYARKLEEYDLIYAMVDERNKRSIRFVEKLGFEAMGCENKQDRKLIRYVKDVKI